MKLSKKEIEELKAFKQLPDNDNIRIKEIIKKKLLSNNKIIYVLNNKELAEVGAEVDEYYGVNIFPTYIINPTQSKVQNFICYDVNFDEQVRHDDRLKYCQIVFTILCEQKNITEETTYIPRHDLLAALILEEFNWTNYFGSQCKCISDEASVVDSDYACRTLVFQMVTPNNLVKTENRYSKIITSEVHV